MMTRRHTKTEIAEKLAQAEAMAVGGMLQRDIAEALQVSIMTLHRWRKATPLAAAPSWKPPSHTTPAALTDEGRIAQFQTENARLRRLVPELLLKLILLQEGAPQHNGNGRKHAAR
jgi:transposase